MPQIEPAARDHVDVRGDLREQARVAVRRAADHLAEPDAARALADRGQRRPALEHRLVRGHGHVVEVVVHPERVEAELLGEHARSRPPCAHLACGSSIEASSIFHVASSSGVATPSRSRIPTSFADARSVTPRSPSDAERSGGSVEARLVVVLARGQVRQHVAHRPTVAARSHTSMPRRRARRSSDRVDPLRSPSGRTDRGRRDPDRPS